jgi:putative tryptophan/tyrosine transport system substrate-binding protein
VRRGAGVLLAPGQEIAIKAARSATQTIPIVMVAVDYDPVALGYVQSLARPGGNITGVYLSLIDLAGKRAQLLKEAVPGISRLIVFWDAVGQDSFKATLPVAQALGLRCNRSNCATRPTITKRPSQRRRRGRATP